MDKSKEKNISVKVYFFGAKNETNPLKQTFILSNKTWMHIYEKKNYQRRTLTMNPEPIIHKDEKEKQIKAIKNYQNHIYRFQYKVNLLLWKSWK
jgi:hypothetical protein